jgi:hypothetical protein
MSVHQLTAHSEQTCTSKAVEGVSAEAGESQVPNMDAILDSYLKRSTSRKAPGRPPGHDEGHSEKRARRREVSPSVQEVLVTAIVTGSDHNAARHLARISEAEMNRLMATEKFNRQIEAARTRDPGLREQQPNMPKAISANICVCATMAGWPRSGF